MSEEITHELNKLDELLICTAYPDVYKSLKNVSSILRLINQELENER